MSNQVILSVMGSEVSADNITEIVQLFGWYNFSIQNIIKMAGDIHLNHSPDNAVMPSCLRFELNNSGEFEVDRVSKIFQKLAAKLNLDIVVQVPGESYKCVVFDMDSTLIQMEVIDELAREAGVYDDVSAITESAMKGEISFDKSFRRRVSLLKGLDVKSLERVWRRVQLMPGADIVIPTLKSLGYKTAIISSGFTYFASGLKKMLDIDYVFANELRIRKDKLTGEINNVVINAEGKANMMLGLARQEKISPDEIVAVGDGANDALMLAQSGMGVAFRAKPILKKQARCCISHFGLDGVLHLLGIDESQFVRL